MAAVANLWFISALTLLWVLFCLLRKMTDIENQSYLKKLFEIVYIEK